MINRSSIILKAKEPFVQWVNAADPYYENPGITLESVNSDRTVYLISEEDAENLEQWLSVNFSTLFENELEGWYVDESLWPENRDRATFDKWFSVECHSVVIDTVGGVIEDDGD